MAKRRSGRQAASKAPIDARVELVAIETLKPWPKNPRKDGDVDGVASSIASFGFVQPIVVDKEGVVVIGHVRLAAATKLGLARVPVIVAAHLSDAEAIALRVRDNKLHEASSWDLELLGFSLTSLQGLDYDIGTLGFAAGELDSILAGVGALVTRELDQDLAPGLPDAATSKPGDIWIMGEHRLMCGNSAELDQVRELLAGARIQLLNMDPPYNVKVEPRSNNAIAAGLSTFSNVKQTHHQKLDLERHPEKAD